MQGHDVKDEDVVVERAASEDEPFAALAFKVATHPFFGRLTYVRVYSGKVAQGAQVLNSTKGRKERIGKMFQMHSNKENPVEEAHAGHIYAFIGLKEVTTGDTLCAIDAPVILESMTFPEPVIHVAIEPKTKADQEKGSPPRSRRLAEEDPTFTVRLDDETGQTVIGGMGEPTSTSSSTGCAGSSRSRRTSAPRRSPTARPSAARWRRSTTRTRSRPVGPASSPRSR